MNDEKNNNNEQDTNNQADTEQLDLEPSQPDVVNDSVKQPLPGEILRKAREGAGMSTQQVAERLRLRVRLIEDIEANNFGDNMEGTFTRGYLKAYARLVQVPENEVLDAYNSMGVTEKPIEQMQSFSRKTALEKDDNKLMILTWIIVLIIIGSVAFFAWQKFQEDTVANGSAANGNGSAAFTDDPAAETLPHERAEPQYEQEPVSRDAVSEPVEESLPGAEELRDAMTDEIVVAGSEQDAAEGLSESVASDSSERLPSEQVTGEQISGEQELSEQVPREQELSEPETVISEEPAPDATESEDAFDPNMAELVFVFNNDVWVRIEDATGEAIAYGVKNAGYVMPLNGVAPYQATIGAPQHVDVYFRGEPVDMSHIRSGRVANIQIPQANENE